MQTAQITNQNTKQLRVAGRAKRWKMRAIGFGFASHWLKKWMSFAGQSQNEAIQNQSNRNLLSTLVWKPL